MNELLVPFVVPAKNRFLPKAAMDGRALHGGDPTEPRQYSLCVGAEPLGVHAEQAGEGPLGVGGAQDVGVESRCTRG